LQPYLLIYHPTTPLTGTCLYSQYEHTEPGGCVLSFTTHCRPLISKVQPVVGDVLLGIFRFRRVLRWASRQWIQVAYNREKKYENSKTQTPIVDYPATYWCQHARQADLSDDQILYLTFPKLPDSRQLINLAYHIFIFSRDKRFKKIAQLRLPAPKLPQSIDQITFVSSQYVAH
jgi:hypothetical protein